eukprot:gene6023-6258_t
MRCHITLQDPVSKQVLKRAFTYSWRMWSVGDVLEMLKEAGFARIAVWVKPSKGSGDSDDEEDVNDRDDDGLRNSAINAVEDEEPYLEYNPATASLAFLNRLTRGWTAYVVAVVKEEGSADVESGPGV